MSLGHLLEEVCCLYNPSLRKGEDNNEGLKHSLLRTVPRLTELPGLSWRDKEERTRVSQGQLRGKAWDNSGADRCEVPDITVRALKRLGSAL